MKGDYTIAKRVAPSQQMEQELLKGMITSRDPLG